MLKTFIEKLNKNDTFIFDIKDNNISIRENDSVICLKLPLLSVFPTTHVYFEELPEIFSTAIMQTNECNPHKLFRINHIFRQTCKEMQTFLWQERMREIGITNPENRAYYSHKL